MPGNKAVYSDAIKKASNAAWDGNWKIAIAEYRRALAEMPQDASVHLSLAHAFEQAKLLDESINECRIACKLSPQDPEPLARIADLQEKQGQLSPAASTYLAVAELYSSTQQTDSAIEMWQRASVLEPERLDAHMRLAQAYEQTEQNGLAAKEYVALAKLFEKRGDKTKMLNHASRALALDPKNVVARTLADKLGRQESTPRPTTNNPADQAKEAALSSLAATLLDERAAGNVVETEAASTPKQRELDSAAVDSLIARAVDAQTQHLPQEAIECYKQLLAAGVTRPEVKFNLAQLYFESSQYDDSIPLLNQTVSDPNYALAGHFTLGRCYRAKGQTEQAAQHLLQVTKIVDLSAVRGAQADELMSVYEGLEESFSKGNHAQAESFSRALEEFLRDENWQDKVKEVRQNLETLRDDGALVSLAEVVELPNSTQVLDALSLSQAHLRNGKYLAASDECLRAIELAPLYIPSHIRLAKTLAQAGRVDEAQSKYMVLADLASTRGELTRAEWFAREAIKLVPDDTQCHIDLIDILIRQKHNQSALEQYVELGNAFETQGQFNTAAEKYAEGIQLAARTGISGPIVLDLHNRIAQARTSQGDFKNALAAYSDIHRRYPDNDQAHVSLVDLELRMGQTNAAIKDLEELLNRLRDRNDIAQAISTLQQLVQNHPDSVTLRARLAQYYVASGDKPNAIAALDSLGEMQLTAGDKQAAAATIRQLISLNPPNVDDYERLLKSIPE